MSPLEPPPDYINLPPPFSPLTSCSLIPGPFLPPHPEFSLALLRLCRGAAPSAAHVELHNYCCLITSGPAGAKMPLATARNIFPSAPSVLSGVWKYPATQRDLTLQHSRAVEFRVLEFGFFSLHVGRAGAPTPPASLRNMEAASQGQ